MTHHEEKGNEHRRLLKLLAEAKVEMQQARQQWKSTSTDSDRFAFQSSITKVNLLEKALWKFQ